MNCRSHQRTLIENLVGCSLLFVVASMCLPFIHILWEPYPSTLHEKSITCFFAVQGRHSTAKMRVFQWRPGSSSRHLRWDLWPGRVIFVVQWSNASAEVRVFQWRTQGTGQTLLGNVWRIFIMIIATGLSGVKQSHPIIGFPPTVKT